MTYQVLNEIIEVSINYLPTGQIDSNLELNGMIYDE